MSTWKAIANFVELVKFGKLTAFGEPNVYTNLQLTSDVTQVWRLNQSSDHVAAE